MGTYDTVNVPCPVCNTLEQFQSKGGDCTLREYELESCPPDVLSNINRHSPHQCIKCNTYFAVDESVRKSIKVTNAVDWSECGPNDWYKR
jgi:hypothetical protein